MFINRLDINRYAPEVPDRAVDCCIMSLDSSSDFHIRSRIVNTHRAALRDFGIRRIDLWYLSENCEKVEATVQDVVALGLKYAAAKRKREHQACHAVGKGANTEQGLWARKGEEQGLRAENDKMGFEEVVAGDSKEDRHSYNSRRPLGYANADQCDGAD
ncbi:hypothetical protein AC579_9613 [Pseudocercospora musae]|uniref:Uncharacterized protein n=1 Tax=Pseudocercospora musae TaxID=113226 RepID=A0A139ITD6_9PEZI|nr:hypothetical protein AC579_9613 [Pseudocercospora musae]